MKLGASNCPDCGNLYQFTRGACTGLECRVEGCQVGWVTSRPPKLYSDEADYICYLARLPTDWMRAVAWIRNRFHIPWPHLRTYKDDYSLPLFTKKARELYHLRSEFENHDIEIRIEPEFTYTESDLNPHVEALLTDKKTLSDLRDFISRDSMLNGIESAWFEAASKAIVAHVKAHPNERFYAGSIWLCYCDYTMFGTPCFALNTESQVAEMGSDWRWSPADWRFSCIDSTVEAMQPLYSAFTKELAGRNKAYWNMTMKEHFAILARVCHRLTHEARSRSGVFASIHLPADFVVGIFEFRESEPLFTKLIIDSIAPEILAKLPHPVWSRPD